jgi:hypothetical protein
VLIDNAAIDAAISRVEALDPDAEDQEFGELAERQPHLLGLLSAACQEMGEEVEELAFDLFFRIDAMFTEARGAPVSTVPEEDVHRGYEAAVAAFEQEIRSGGGDLLSHSAQPGVMEYVVEFVSQPLEDEEGDEFELEEDDRADLVVAFRTVIRIMEERAAKG